MKKIILILLIASSFLYAHLYTHYKLYEPFAKYFNQQHCSLILDKYYYLNCYSFKYKDSKAVAYKLEGDLLNKPPAGKRPAFKTDVEIPKPYQAQSKDYIHSGYDRGHILSNKSMNATLKAQESTFLMSNITPQNPQINRRVWIKAEQREREVAKLKGVAQVLNLIIYPQDSKLKYIKDNIAIPEFYIKIIEAKDLKECYKYPNHDVENESLSAYKVDCEKIFMKIL